MRLERPSLCGVTVVHEVHVEKAVQQQSINSALRGTETGSIRFFRSNYTKQGDIMCAALSLSVFIAKLLKGDAE